MKLFFIFVIGSSIRDEVTCLDMGGTGQKTATSILEVAVSIFICYICNTCVI